MMSNLLDQQGECPPLYDSGDVVCTSSSFEGDQLVVTSPLSLPSTDGYWSNFLIMDDCLGGTTGMGDMLDVLACPDSTFIF